MLGRKEIETLLNGLNTELIVAFSARCSLRILPVLIANTEGKDFFYWDKDKLSQILLSLLFALKVTLNNSSFILDD